MPQVMDLGKLDPELLSREVLEVLPCTDERVLIGPGIGEDTSVVSLSGLSDHLLVASSDPITGAEHDIGRYAVHVNANDVATAGARPSLFLCNILLSKSSSREELRSILSQIRRECEALQISVIGGHTEVSPIERTVVSSTMLGFVRRDMLARRRVEPGDLVVLTKGAGVEGTSIIAAKRSEELGQVLGEELVERARGFASEISVVPEAMVCSQHHVKRMHDPTEGGVLGGLMELSTAASISLEVRLADIPVAAETDEICKVLGLDPLRLIGSGSLLSIFDPSDVDEALSELSRSGIEASVIGRVSSVGRPELWVEDRGGRRRVTEFPKEELWRAVV